MAALKYARGVAALTPSTALEKPLSVPLMGALQWVMAAGYETIRKALPASAGFIKLLPNPPNDISRPRWRTRFPARPSIRAGLEAD